jgi:hypothetical protein
MSGFWSYDPSEPCDRWATRYGGYTLDTLAEFEERGIATYDVDTDTWTLRFEDGTVTEIRNEFNPNT